MASSRSCSTRESSRSNSRLAVALADAVLVAWATDEGELDEVDAVVIEIQVHHDELKYVSWVVYRAGVRSRHRCRGWTLVVSPEADVRRRARELFEFEPRRSSISIRHIGSPSWRFSRQSCTRTRKTRRPVDGPPSLPSLQFPRRPDSAI